jgi:hypothetical protein
MSVRRLLTIIIYLQSLCGFRRFVSKLLRNVDLHFALISFYYSQIIFDYKRTCIRLRNDIKPWSIVD